MLNRLGQVRAEKHALSDMPACSPCSYDPDCVGCTGCCALTPPEHGCPCVLQQGLKSKEKEVFRSASSAELAMQSCKSWRELKAALERTGACNMHVAFSHSLFFRLLLAHHAFWFF